MLVVVRNYVKVVSVLFPVLVVRFCLIEVMDIVVLLCNLRVLKCGCFGCADHAAVCVYHYVDIILLSFTRTCYFVYIIYYNTTNHCLI